MRSYRTFASAFSIFVRRIAVPWSKPQLRNLIILGTALSRERSLPVRRLARAIVGPRQVHRHLDKRFRRFLGNPNLDLEGALAAYLRFLLPRFGGQPFIPVMLDWTYLHHQRAILWGQIPYRGRAFPLFPLVFPWAQLAPEGQTDEHAQTTVELAWLELLARCWPEGAPPPLLLADRGFPKADLLVWLHAHGWFFLIRARHNQVLRNERGRRRRLQRIPVGTTVHYPHLFGLAPRVPMHAVITSRLHKGSIAYWRLLTNLPEAFLPQAPRLYAQRMQPEQIHRDCKNGHFVSGYALGHLGRMLPQRLQNLLFCVGLWFAFLILLAESDAATREWLIKRHWGLSLSTFGLDLVRFFEDRLPRAIKWALDWVHLAPLWAETGDS